MATIITNTANTISVNFSPGQDIMTPATSSQSLFTFGDYQLQEAPIGFGIIDLTGKTFSNANLSNNQSLTNGTFNYNSIYNANLAKLNLQPEQPTSYAYFSSFYGKIAQSINSIVQNFPFAIMSDVVSAGNNIVSINYDMFSNVTSLYIDESTLVNQASLIYKSGSSTYNVFNNYSDFSLQLSGTGDASVYPIIYYTYSGASQQLFFQVTGNIFSGVSPSLNFPIYIRPSLQVLGQFKQTLSQLDYQVLYSGEFSVPSIDDNSFVLSTYTWTKYVDGFNPDIEGAGFDAFLTSILNDSKRVDEVKTNIFLRTIIPENLIDLDSEDKIYQKLTQVYANEFDEIKRYIDGIAFAHSVNYERVNSVPNVYLQRLSTLLGMDLKNSFSDVDFFEYIAGDPEGTGFSYQDFNYELWTRILVNLNFLYKRKGTRDAIMFMFKILGAPDCLVNFNEFVYKVTDKATPLSDFSVASDGYPDIRNNPTIFQGSGSGRGNGQAFIDFYQNSYNLQRTADNIKVYTGETSISSTTESNTRNIVNSKEVDIFLDPAQLIECDVKNWYALGYGYWNWGSTGTCVSPYSGISFSGLTVPFEWSLDTDTCLTMNPPNMSDMTIVQYMEYLYATFVDPRNRKTYPNYDFTSYIYLNLKKIYINYMYWGGGQESNRLKFQQIDSLLTVIERGFNTFGQQFIPATTITNGPATLYRNTMFERQKFVYKPGINDGSEFKKALPPELDPNINTNNIAAKVNEIIHDTINANNIIATLSEIIHPVIITNHLTTNIIPPTNSTINTNSINIQVPPTNSLNGVMSLAPTTTIIAFPIQ